jgi:hypothetical protein
MAIALEEIAAGVVDSTVGPWAFALGAGAVAVAFATGSTRPLSRMMAGSVVAADAAGKITPRQWLVSLGREVRRLVDEARAEYEADRHPLLPTPQTAAGIVVGASRRSMSESEHALTVTDAGTSLSDLDAGHRRDTRGRFSRRSPNGTGSA